MNPALQPIEDIQDAEIARVGFQFDPSGAAYIAEERLLIVSDLHLEKGSSFARRRVFLPPYDTTETLSRLHTVVSRFQPQRVICLGDSFHDQQGAARLPVAAIEMIASLASGRDWLWISGNHDPLPPENLPGDRAEEIGIGPLVFRHEPERSDPHGQVCGHLHPAARVSLRGQSVRRPCFAADANRLVMPAFGAFTGCLNVLDPAFAGLFAGGDFKAWMLARGGVIPVASRNLRPD